jgi:hypothetical protein
VDETIRIKVTAAGNPETSLATVQANLAAMREPLDALVRAECERLGALVAEMLDGCRERFAALADEVIQAAQEHARAIGVGVENQQARTCLEASAQERRN